MATHPHLHPQVFMREMGKRHRKLRWMRTLGPITACIIGLMAVGLGHVDTKANMKIVGTIPKGA